jgi:predicted ATPase
MRALFASLSALSPLLIVLDDLQWVDNSSCNLLGYLVRNFAHQRVILVGTSRAQGILTTHPLHSLFTLLQQQEMMTEIVLLPLTESQIGQFVAHLPPSVAQAI